MVNSAGNILACNSQSVKKAAAKNSKQTEYRIKDTEGLVLVVQPSGSASYYVYYKVRLGQQSKLRKFRLGNRDIVSLKDARSKTKEILAKVAAGEDPVSEKNLQKSEITFKELAEKRLEEDDRLAPRTREYYESCYRNYVYPAFGDVPAKDVSPEMVVGLLDKVEKRSKVRADATKSSIGSAFKWGIKRRRVKKDPTVGLGNRSPGIPRHRILSESELKKVWHGIEEHGGKPETKIIIKLALLTGQRETEIAGALDSELELDCPEPKWTIKGDQRRNGSVVKGRTKNRKDQIVPLTEAAVDLFKEAQSIKRKSPYVFPADLSRVKVDLKTGKRQEPKTPHLRGDSVGKAMSRIREAIGVDDINVHDFRSCIATWCGDQGIRPDVIDRILNHAPKGVTARHYNFSTLEPLVREALQGWNDHLDAVVSGKMNQSKVISLRAS